jgi:uncharacterized protein (DUF433 family)
LLKPFERVVVKLMTVVIETKPVPLERGEHGVIRITGTRVPLDTVVIAFRNGDTAEEIADSYDVLDLADVYAVISFYLSHQEEVDDYMRQRAKQAAELRHEIETRFPPEGIRERLLARRKRNAETGGRWSAAG